jgi:MerR family glutamine synthetase transcriptional repressor
MKIWQSSLDLGQLEDREYKISKVAEIIGVSTRTLRYWQENNLIIPHATHSTERLYLLQDIKRALHIKDLQELFGFSLSEIKQILMIEDRLLQLKEAHEKNPDDQLIKLDLKRSALSETNKLLNLIDDKISRIQNYKNELTTIIEKIENHIN